jgi:Bacterial transcriptional activator domain/Transcriptional regulatory protein, C terminal
VLADLLLHANEVVPSEQFLVDLWGEDAPPGAANALQVATSRLRRLLPPGRLITGAPGYTLRIFLEELDVKRFERLLSEGRDALAAGAAAEAPQALGQALSLWQDPALADFAEAGILLQRQGVSLASCLGLATGEALVTAAEPRSSRIIMPGRSERARRCPWVVSPRLRGPKTASMMALVPQATSATSMICG